METYHWKPAGGSYSSSAAENTQKHTNHPVTFWWLFWEHVPGIKGYHAVGLEWISMTPKLKGWWIGDRSLGHWWWQLTNFLFFFLGERIHFGEHIFQLDFVHPPTIKSFPSKNKLIWGKDLFWNSYFSSGWFNHQLLNHLVMFFSLSLKVKF